MNKKIFLCAICNISSGSCKQDCKFCTQSSKYKANIDRYHQKPIEQIVNEAKIAKQNGAIGFCLVSAGKGLDDKKLEFVCKSAKAIRDEIGENLNLIACNGTASIEQIKELKKAGINSYNHNLESSEEFYNEICSTHSWQERFQTCLNIKEVGLHLCSGGIYGMGESQNDRISLIKSLKELKVNSTPINFYHPNDALPIKSNPLSIDEAFEIIKLVKAELPETMLMIAGGREYMFKDRQSEIFSYGVNSIVIGDYLTTKGESVNKDKEMLENLGLEIANSC